MNYIERKEEDLKKRIIPQTANKDFAEFWQKHVENLKKIPVEFERRLLKTPYDKTITTYEISFNTHDDTVVYAYFSKPANMEGKLPCVVWYHGGGGKRRIYPNIVACGVCCFAMDVRSQHGKTFDLAQYQMGTDYVIGSMVTHDILHKDSYYLKNIYLDAVRALDVVALLPEVDNEKIVIKKFMNADEIMSAIDEFYDYFGYDIIPIGITEYDDYICFYLLKLL